MYNKATIRYQRIGFSRIHGRKVETKPMNEVDPIEKEVKNVETYATDL